jgi:hypothetical protein
VDYRVNRRDVFDEMYVTMMGPFGDVLHEFAGIVNVRELLPMSPKIEPA